MHLSPARTDLEPLVERLFVALDGPPRQRLTEERLIDYLQETCRWGARIDLVAARSLDEFVDLSLADAVVLAKAEWSSPGEANRWIDVGSGGGAPGIPLFSLLAQARGAAFAGTLVEPRTKRAAFLRNVVGRLELGGVQVERKRSDDLRGQGWDVAVSRATLPSAQWLEEGGRLAKQAVWVLLARGEPPTCGGWQMDQELRYRWPLTGAERRAVRYVVDP